MFKKILKIVVVLVAFVLMLEGSRALLLIYPQPFFAHSFSFEQATFYSDEPFNEEKKELLKAAIHRASATEIYNPSISHQIFLCSTERKYTLFSSLAGKNKFSQGINVEPTGNIFISEPFVEAIQSTYGQPFLYTVLEGSIVHVITHEILHTLITHKVGYWGSRKLPVWKKEGYAEYGASMSVRKSSLVLDFKDEVDRFYNLNNRTISPQRLLYLKSQLMIAYLIEIEGQNFDAIMNHHASEEEVFTKLSTWYHQQ